VQQTIYLATANTGAQDKDDMFKILSNTAPSDVRDADIAAECKLESYDKTPSFDA
jgi:branched-chain amino acid transport system substrate-binding protein